MAKTLSCIIVVVFLSIFFASPSSADHRGVKSEKQAENVVKFRQSLLQLVRSNMLPLGAMAKGRIPYDTEVMNINAMRIEQLGLMMEDYFTPNASSFDVSSNAKSEIWANFDDFTAKTSDLIVAAKSLQEVAAEGDERSFRGAIGKLGGTCKACHDEYKEE
ncbi:MAG: cytochrome c [Pseudomonadota bacterium]